MAKEIFTKKGEVILVDDEDYWYLNLFAWHLSKGYAFTTQILGEYGDKTAMHRLLMNTPDGMITDHRNRVRRDNRKSNLRNCLPLHNSFNRIKGTNCKQSKYIGVKTHNGKYWTAVIYTNSKHVNLGSYNSEQDAALAYDRSVEKLHTEFRILNFPNSKVIPQRRISEGANKFRGVVFCKQQKKWRAQIFIKGKKYHSKRVPSEIGAAILYNELATRLKGDLAILNVLPELALASLVFPTPSAE